MVNKPVVLCILDGWGIPEDNKYSAIAKANTPNYDKLLKEYPNSKLNASGEFVGLPDGQMGNSEVGHTNIGAGRVVYQDLPKINKSIANNTLKDNKTIINAISKLKKNSGNLHLMGLLSDGGVHSHINHIISLAKIFAENGINVYMHSFLDGRDTPQKSAITYIKQFIEETKDFKNIKIATIAGRYYAMDRDKRWDRIEKAYDVLTQGDAINSTDDFVKYIENSYKEEKTDEFIEPVAIKGFNGINNGDGFLFANYRADRAREITMALGNKDFNDFSRKKIVKFEVALQLTEYSVEHNKFLETVFPPEDIINCLGEVISNKELKQLRIAETEKYAHVTFFFNGGKEKEFKGEDRILVNSPKVATYDLQPEMSASELTTKLIEAIKSKKYDLIIVNYANPDMVGHTGIMDAAVKACEEVDKDLGKVIDAVKSEDGIIFVTADHGNAEKMFDEKTGQPHTAHTTNLVPFIMVGNKVSSYSLENGSLCDIAPTILKVMDIEKPKEMSGKILIRQMIQKMVLV